MKEKHTYAAGSQRDVPPSSVVTFEEIRPIKTRLDEISRSTGESTYTVFGDWLELIIASFATDDDSYDALVQDYRDQHGHETTRTAFRLFAEALGELTLTMERTNADVLGELYERFSLTSDQFAQHFTPEAVCQTLAATTLPDEAAIQEATADDPLQVGDPTCGSGRLLITTARHLQHVAPETPAVFVGQDIDGICARMTVVNFVLFGISGFVAHGDSLTAQMYRCWRVEPAATHHSEPIVRECSPADLPDGRMRASR